MNNFADQCRQFAQGLRRRSIVVALLTVAALVVAASMLALDTSPKAGAVWLLALTVLGAGISTLALSVHLHFDAALFEIMATYPDELAAGRAVDEHLAKRALRNMPASTRPLSDRVAGTKRLMNRQLLAAATTGCATLALLANLA